MERYRLQEQLGDKPFLAGAQFTVADAYLFVMLNWTGHIGMDLGRWPRLKAYCERIAQRPSVQAARAMEQGKS